MPHEHPYSGPIEHLPQDLLADLGLVKPRHILSETLDRIFPPHSPVELEGVAADDLFLSEVGAREAARGHAAEVSAWFQQNYLQPFARAADGRHHATRRTAVDHKVVPLLCECRENTDEKNGECSSHRYFALIVRQPCRC